MNRYYRQTVLVCLGLLLLGGNAYSQKGKAKPKNDPPVSIGSLADGSFRTFNPTGMAVAVVKDGEMIYNGGFGLKSADKKVPMDTKAVFNIASCTKAFTAAAMAMLVEQGKVKWDDKVIDYVPGFQLADPWITAQLTIRDLLCHRSGLETFYGDLLWYGTDYTDEQILSRLRHIPLHKQFRSEFGYQNNLYMVAGLVIQRVSGRTWEQFIQENFFTPLSMSVSRTSNDQLKPGDNIAYGHVNGKQQEIFDFNGTKPAASIYSSVEDLSKWMIALMNGGMAGETKLLSKESIRTLWSAHTVIPVSQNAENWGIHFRAYALGWTTFDYNGKKVVEHDGGMPGYISKVCLVPEEKLGIVILNNGQDFQVNDALRYKLLDHVLKNQGRDWDSTFLYFRNAYKKYEESQNAERAAGKMQGTKPSLDLAAYTGTYHDPAYGVASVELKNGELSLSLHPAKKTFSSVMTHWHFDTFKVQFKDDFLTYGLVTFEVGPNGVVNQFRIDLPSDDFQFFELNFRRVKG